MDSKNIVFVEKQPVKVVEGETSDQQLHYEIDAESDKAINLDVQESALSDMIRNEDDLHAILQNGTHIVIKGFFNNELIQNDNLPPSILVNGKQYFPADFTAQPDSTIGFDSEFSITTDFSSPSNAVELSDQIFSRASNIELNLFVSNNTFLIDLDTSNFGLNSFTTFTENSAFSSLSPKADIMGPITVSNLTVRLTNAQIGDFLLLTGETPSSLSTRFNADNTEITFSGSASTQIYEDALALVAFSNPLDNLVGGFRSIEYIASNGDTKSDVSQGIVQVIPVNDAPLLGVNDAVNTNLAANFTEDGQPANIADVSAISDVDDSNIESATITLINPFLGDVLVLNATLPSGIIVSNTSTATNLILTGSASLANYQAALNLVGFNNPGDNFDTTDRIVEVVVNDGDDNSNTSTTTITLNLVNDAPQLGVDDAVNTNLAVNFIENNGAINLADVSAIADPDDVNIESATITLTNPFTSDALALSAALPVGIILDGASTTTNLILTGSASFADYQAALDLVTFNNPEDNFNATDRVVEFVINDGDLNSNISTTTITMVAVNDPPAVDLDGSVTGINYVTTYNQGGAPVSIADTDIDVSDVDDTNIESAVIELINPFLGDTLLVGSIPSGISFNAVGNIITLSGSASLVDYETAIHAITFENGTISPDTAQRFVTVTVNDGDINSATAIATINVVPLVPVVNDPPQLDLDADNSTIFADNFLTSYIENGTAVNIADIDPLITDTDDVNLESARIIFENLQTDDVVNIDSAALTLLGINAITLTDPNGFNVILTGTASFVNYQTALQSITFENSGDNPSTITRIVNVTVNDGNDNSNVGTAQILVTAVNDPIQLDLDADDSSGAIGTGFNNTFTEGSGSVAIVDSDVSVNDPDNINVQGGEISVLNPELGDLLTIDTVALSGIAGGAITAVINSDTDISLVGATTNTDYESALQLFRIENTSTFFASGDRSVEIILQDSQNSPTAIATIAMIDRPELDLEINDPGNDVARSFAIGSSGVTIARDPGGTNIFDTENQIFSVTVNLTNPLELDRLFIGPGLPGFINATVSLDGYTVLLDIGGGFFSSTNGNFENALESVSYINDNALSTDFTPRNISVVVNDGTSNSDTAFSVIQPFFSPVLDLDADNSTEPGFDFRTTYTEGDPAIAIIDIGDVTIFDLDDTLLVSAFVDPGILNFGDNYFSTAGDGVIIPGTNIFVDKIGGQDFTFTGTDTIANYILALETLRFVNSRSDLDTSTNVIQFQVFDSLGGSNVAQSFIELIDVPDNNPPVFDPSLPVAGTPAEFSTTYFDDGGPIPVVDIGNVLLDDLNSLGVQEIGVDRVQLSIFGAVGFQILTNGSLPTTITETNIGNSRVITFIDNGGATFQDFIDALELVEFSNPNLNFNEFPGTIRFDIQDNEGLDIIVNTSITLIDRPEVDLDGDNSSGAIGNDFNTNYVIGNNPILIGDTDLQLVDFENNFDQIVITLTNPQTGDSLSIANPPLSFLTGIVSGAGDSVTITEPGSSVNILFWEQALKDIRFSNNNPLSTNTTTRIIEVVGTNNDGIDSLIATATIAVFAPPILDLDSANVGDDFQTVFNKTLPPIPITGPVLILDGDDINLASATVTLTNPELDDLLLIGALPAGIILDAGSSSNQLILTGATTLADYQTALENITFDNTGTNPIPSVRDIQIIVVDDDGNTDTATSNINVAGNIPPGIDLDADNSSGEVQDDFATSFVEGGAPVSIADLDLTVTDADDASLLGATITLTNPQTGDILAGGTVGPLTGVLVGNTLSISGLGTLAEYTTAIQSVTLSNTESAPNGDIRLINVSVNDGIVNSNIATAKIDVVPTFFGTSGDDTFGGSPFNEFITGGPGNDNLTGGGETDTFFWNSGDDGTVATPAVDTLPDFTVGVVGLTGDVLDFSDLLVGEESGVLTDYFSFVQSGVDTVIEITPSGAGGHTQEVVIENVDLTFGGSLTDAQIISNLVNDGQVVVDVI